MHGFIPKLYLLPLRDPGTYDLKEFQELPALREGQLAPCFPNLSRRAPVNGWQSAEASRRAEPKRHS